MDWIKKIDFLGDVERKILKNIVDGLAMGQAEYGRFKLIDDRDWVKEALEEARDMTIYLQRLLIMLDSWDLCDKIKKGRNENDKLEERDHQNGGNFIGQGRSDADGRHLRNCVECDCGKRAAEEGGARKVEHAQDIFKRITANNPCTDDIGPGT